MDFCLRNPARVATLTICDSLTGFGHLTVEQRREFIRLRKEPLLQGKEPKDIAPVVARTLIGKSARPGSFERLVASMSALHKESYIKTIEGGANYARVLELEKIAVPTHVVVGDEDELTPPAMSREMAARVAGAKADDNRGCGSSEQHRAAGEVQSRSAGVPGGISRACVVKWLGGRPCDNGDEQKQARSSRHRHRTNTHE